MSIQNFSPRFIKAQVVFQLGETTYDMGEQLMNPNGIPGVKWEQFDPESSVGKKVSVYMVVHCANPFKFSCTGTLTLENTEKDKFMGIALLLNANDTRQVDEVITQEGMLPEYVRKYPRIPYIHRVGMMPFNVLTEFLIGKERNTCVFHLDNISPSGFQVYTEDPRVACLQPGHSVFVSFMPRGDGFIPVQLPATIRRMIQSKDPVSENMRYYFGMSMGTVTVEQRLNYSALLRRIVEELKA